MRNLILLPIMKDNYITYIFIISDCYHVAEKI
jgi:hypothetical protein